MKKLVFLIVLFTTNCLYNYAQNTIQIGETKDAIQEPGTIRWNGSDFEGWDGLNWNSFTTNNSFTKTFTLFDDFKSFDFSSEPSINRVVTLGHTVNNIGAAIYYKIGTGIPDTGNEGELTTSDSSKWKIMSFPLSVEQFGAIPKGTSISEIDIPQNNTEKINNFLSFITENDVGVAFFSGTFEVNNTISLGYKNDRTLSSKVKTTHITGSPIIELVSENQINTVFEIFAFSFSLWEGRITVKATGTTVWSNRKCLFCVKISGCSRSIFGGFTCKGAKVFGLLCSSELIPSGNSNLLNLGDCRFDSCGSGSSSIDKDSYFMTANWLGNKVETSSGGTKSSILKVSAIPDDDALLRARAYPFLFMENGDFHYVREINRTTNEVTMQPILDNTLNESKFKWVFGGGLALRGSDVGVVNINSIDVVNCAIGLDMMSIYGPVAQRVVAQSCFAGMCFGLRSDAAMISANILAFYNEGNVGAFIPLAKTNAANYNISTVYSLNLNTDVLYIKTRSSDNSLNEYNGLNNFTITKKGNFLSHEKKSENKAETHSSITYKIDNSNKLQTYRKNNATILLDIDLELHKTFGFDSGQLTFIGTGSNHSPTGMINFIPKDASITVNGADNWEVSDFNGPAIFSIYYEYKNRNFIIATTNKN